MESLRKERAKAIKKQFALRKAGKGKKVKRRGSVKFPRVRAAEFTAGKVAGLDVKTREDYLDLIENSLTKNYQLMGDGSLKSKDLLDAAIDAEYEGFTNIKDVNMYRKKVATLIHGIKSCTIKAEMAPLLNNVKEEKEDKKKKEEKEEKKEKNKKKEKKEKEEKL